MNTNANFNIRRIAPLLIIFLVLAVAGCDGSQNVSNSLDVAEDIMEDRPDSSLAILNSINKSDLNKKSLRARYALLKSMALDKTYVDLKSFDVMQPAIDYYFKEGTPKEKLRTYYYKGRIHQNRHERDSALQSYIKGLDVGSECEDSLTIARALVVQGGLYKDFYDFNGYFASFLKAADIYNRKNLSNQEFDCLLNALNGTILLNIKEQSDSIINLLDRFQSLDESQYRLLQGDKLTYAIQYGSIDSIKAILENNGASLAYDTNGLLNLTRAYNLIGENVIAKSYLDYLDKIDIGYDTLKYLSIKYRILEDLHNYEESLATYKDCINRLETINSTKFEQKSRSMEEKHQMELQAERDARKYARKIWSLIGGIGVLVFILAILLLILKNIRTQKRIALERARRTDAEKKELQTQNDLALERAQRAEVEKKELQTQNELAQEQARRVEAENERLQAEKDKIATENRNLQLDLDNKALEAENLAMRVRELDSESNRLKEILDSRQEMPEEVRSAIRTRIEMLNSYLAGHITDNRDFEKAYDQWVEQLTADTEGFMDSNRLVFQASHPDFIKYFEDHGLTTAEINYVCLYAIGLRGKEVGSYMRKRSHVNTSSAIRQKLGIDKHETNIGIYVRKLLRQF